jgi:acyl transferase domain-containing protein
MIDNTIRTDDIAVIGLGGRFPGASCIEQFWSNCCNGQETIYHFSKEELLTAGVPAATLDNPNYIRSKGIIEQVDLFDAEFFGMSEQDAKILDPQQRLFLLSAWETLEHAGYARKKMASRVGVFASTGISLYLLHNILNNKIAMQSLDEYQVLLANDKDFLATRVSYLLNLKGPSVNIQTGCSSSLVCIHYAAQSLLNGECDMAIAGGVSITIPQEQGYLYRKDMIGSDDGHCYAFDKRAQGTVKSNGVGTVLLKPLSDAIQDQDTIYAVIRGSAINNDGAQKVGYTAPNAAQQTAVIKEAVQMADVDKESIAYIETHGTGTLLGDPIEIAALKNAFQPHKHNEKQCALASLKTNIGHLDVAAGVAGFIKVCLALYYGKIPPSLNFSELNPKISLENSPFYINTTLCDWPAHQRPRRAGVSAFGVGGTNAHIVLQEAPLQQEQKKHPKTAALCFISARSQAALHRNIHNLIRYCQQHPNTSVHDMAFTLRYGRETFPYRAYILAENIHQFIENAYQVDVKTIKPEMDTSQHEVAHDQDQPTRRIPLPTYSWDLKRYWIEADTSETVAQNLKNIPISTSNDIRSAVENAWKKTLGVEPLSDDDHFFNQGGHSLSALHFIDQLPASIRESIQVMHLYQYPTFSQLLRFLESQPLLPFIHNEQYPEELFTDGSEL